MRRPAGRRRSRRRARLDSTRAGPGRADWRRPHDRGRLGRRGRPTTGGALRRRAGARRPGARVPRVAGRGSHVRGQHRLRALRLRVDPARAGGRAPASAPSQPRLRRRRAVPGRRRARRDAAPREHPRQGLLRRAGGDGRAARHGTHRRPRPACPVPWLGGGERRSRTARASRAPAGRRGGGDPRRRAPPGSGCPARGRSRADRPGGEGRALAHQRDAVHDRDGSARPHAGTTPRARRRHRLRDVARGAPGHTDELPSVDPRCPTAPGPDTQRRDASRAPRRLRDRRVAPLVRQGPGRLLAALRTPGARRQPRSPRLRRAHRRRSSSTRPPTTRSSCSRTS